LVPGWCRAAGGAWRHQNPFAYPLKGFIRGKRQISASPEPAGGAIRGNLGFWQGRGPFGGRRLAGGGRRATWTPFCSRFFFLRAFSFSSRIQPHGPAVYPGKMIPAGEVGREQAHGFNRP